MKKFLCVLMSLAIALSFATLVFAADNGMSKTEAFIKSMENGVGVNANLGFGTLNIDGELYVQKDKASANVTLGPINAKAMLDGDKFTAYFGIFKADVSQLVPSSTIRELKGIVNEVPKAFAKFDTEMIFKYLEVDEENTKTLSGGKFVEAFGPDYEAIADLIKEQNPDAITEADTDDIVAFCEYFKANDKTVGALLNSKAAFTYEDASAKTLIEASVTIPDDKGNLQTIDIFKTLKQTLGITVGYITIDIPAKAFKAPFALLNLTWLIKLIIKAA